MDTAKDVIDYQVYREQWAEAGQGKLTSAPTHIDLELASICNYKCPFCPQAETHVAFDRRFMDTKMALKLLHEAKSIGILSVKLNWRGESTLHLGFSQIAWAAINLGFLDTMLNTNGSYDDPFVHAAILDLDTVIFSVDTLDEKKAKLLRPGGPLKTVLDNLEDVAWTHQTTGLPARVKVNFTRQKENWDERSEEHT